MSKYYSEKKKVTNAIKDIFIEDLRKLNDAEIDCIDSEDYVFELSMKYEYSDKGVRDILDRFAVKFELKSVESAKGKKYYLKEEGD